MLNPLTVFFFSQALDALLDLSASSYEQSKSCKDNVNNRQDTRFLSECSDSVSNKNFIALDVSMDQFPYSVYNINSSLN